LLYYFKFCNITKNHPKNQNILIKNLTISNLNYFKAHKLKKNTIKIPVLISRKELPTDVLVRLNAAK